MRVPTFLLPIARPLSDALYRLSLKLASREVAGPCTIYWASEADQESLAPRLREALSLVRSFEPCAWDDLQAFGPSIVVGGLERSEIWARNRTLQLRLALVRDHPPISIAVVLVGLVARAALSNRAHQWNGSDCTRHALSEQVRFVRRLREEKCRGADQLFDWLRMQQQQLGSESVDGLLSPGAQG